MINSENHITLKNINYSVNNKSFLRIFQQTFQLMVLQLFLVQMVQEKLY